MEPVTMTAVATAIATIILTKALEKGGEKLGDVVIEQAGKLTQQITNKLPKVTGAIEKSEQQPLDIGEAVLELKAAADKDTELAQAVLEVEAAAQADPKVAQKVPALVSAINSTSATVINSTKLADYIKNVFQGNTIIGGMF